MFVAELNFSLKNPGQLDILSDTVNQLLGALRMNGQICGQEWPMAITDAGCQCTVLVPNYDSLKPLYHNQYVNRALAQLKITQIDGPQINIRGRDIDGVEVCQCENPSCYILFTNYVLLAPPIRCGDCFQSIPLYTLPQTEQDEYYNIICWQSDYQACDTLQMNCNVLDRAATRELSRLDSRLTQAGLEICRELEGLTGKATYYYLYRYGGRSRKQELERLCPSCGGKWLLETPWHKFDFKCENCYLVSNIAWDV